MCRIGKEVKRKRRSLANGMSWGLEGANVSEGKGKAVWGFGTPAKPRKQGGDSSTIMDRSQGGESSAREGTATA